MTPGKRAFDVAFSVAGIVALSPFLFLVAAAIKIDDRGPIFFRQERIGREGIPFRIWKFRTMVQDAEKVGKQITVGRDPRITRVGHVLRKMKLDELPQLWNVLLGNMSFVGPRPEVAKYVELYNEEQRQILLLTPGITDMASIKYRNENEILAASSDPERTYIEEIMPDKIRINLEQVGKASLFESVRVILLTLRAIVSSH